MSLWKLMASDNISQHPELPGRMDLSATAESGKQLQERQSKMSEHEVSWKCEDSHPIHQPKGHRSRIKIDMVTSG